jgi:hypothetical protein
MAIWGRCPRDRGGQTCTYQDGSQKVFGNDEVGLKGLAASFSLVGICGGLAVLFFMIVAAIVGGEIGETESGIVKFATESLRH